MVTSRHDMTLKVSKVKLKISLYILFLDYEQNIWFIASISTFSPFLIRVRAFPFIWNLSIYPSICPFVVYMNM